MKKSATSLVRTSLAMAGLFVLAFLVAVAAQSSGAASYPTLTIPELIPAPEGQPVVVPVVFDKGTADNVNTFVFNIGYDAKLLMLDTTDANSNGIPDAIAVTVPTGFSVTIEDKVSGGNGGLFVTIVNTSSPLSGMPSQSLLEITFVAGLPPQPIITDVDFSSEPAPFFADKQGKVISGIFDGGSVAIGDVVLPTATATKVGPPATMTPTASATPLVTVTQPGPTLTPSATATSGPSPTPFDIAFYMPAIVYAFTPTATPTATATATATSTATATATAMPPTATPNPATSTPKPPTATPQPPTPTPGPVCGNLVLNGGMEDYSGWLINVNAFPASYVSGIAHNGARSMRIGIVNWWDNRYSYSSVQQDVTIPQTAKQATLGFWLLPTTTGRSADKMTPPAIVPTEFTDGTLSPLADDVQMVLLFDQAGTQHVLLFQRQSFGTFAYYEVNLNRFAGQRVTLYFGVFNNGTGGITGMYLDDVSLTYCN